MNEFFKNITDVSPQKTNKPEEKYVTALRSIIGLTINQVEESIIGDLDDLIKKERKQGLDGYVHCLYRIMNRDVSWGLIMEAYRRNSILPPDKYKSLFGQTEKEGFFRGTVVQ